jgi:hypothetical protein
MPTPSWELVIDASILRAAGSEGATHPVSTYSRRVLLDILEICHRAVVSRSIKDEWDTHQSKFSRTWRVQMYSRRKIGNRSSRNCEHLRQAVKACERINEKDRQAAEKDFLLVEAALNGDNIILSVDDRARNIYCELSRTIHDFGDIFWLNPIEEASSMRKLLKGDTAFKAMWKLDPRRGV